MALHVCGFGLWCFLMMASKDHPKRCLCVGLACLDMVLLVEEFPQEDTDQSVQDYYWQRGGNAATTSTVLAMLGERSEFMGTMAADLESSYLQDNLKSYGVISENVKICQPEVTTPVSVVMINTSNGSRTILHHCRNLPQLEFSDFRVLDLSQYKWIHFEGQPNADNIKQMILAVIDYNSKVADKIKISLELEKPGRKELDQLIGYADVTFISKEKADSERLYSKEDVVRTYIKKCKAGGAVICAWGDQGAAALTTEGLLCTSPVFSPDQVVDTLGAGDTFNAATIFALCQGRSIQDAITLGCKVAGAKCGMKGNNGLKDIVF